MQATAPLEDLLHAVQQDIQGHFGSGRVADCIPALARVDPRQFGLALHTCTGERAAVGDSAQAFSIQSVSKVFTLTLALGRVGDALWRRVGRMPSGSPFNSIVQLEREQGIPRNPFINAGALVVTDASLANFIRAFGNLLHPVGGGILAIAPRKAAIAVWAPGLIEAGNSLVGALALETLSRRAGSNFNAACRRSIHIAEQRRDRRSDRDVFLHTEGVTAHAPMAVDQHEAGGPLKAVAAHGDRDRVGGVRCNGIHAHRKANAVLVQKRFQRYRRHRGMVLEDRVQADHGHVVVGERGLDALRLRQSVVHAGRAQHLKGMQHDHPALQ